MIGIENWGAARNNWDCNMANSVKKALQIASSKYCKSLHPNIANHFIKILQITSFAV